MSLDTTPISVLCVDDEPGMADLIGTYLERTDDQLHVTAVTSAAAGLEALDKRGFDCIVSDYDMPEMDGLTFLQTVRADHPGLPFILFTGRGSEEIASDAISAGVTDYMQKESTIDQYQVLSKRVRNAVTRYRARYEAEEAQKRAETILEASPDAILVSVDGECVFANPAASDLLGVDSPETLYGRSFTELLSTEETLPTDTFDPIESGDEIITQLQQTLTLPDGDSRPIEMTARHIAWDGADGVVSIIRDISERVARTEELAYQKSLLESVFESTMDGILVTDTEWNILNYNDQFAELWGLSEELLETGASRQALDAVRDKVAEPDEFVRSIEAQYDRAIQQQRRQVELIDGTIVDQYSTPITDANGIHMGYVWSYRDITDLQELQRQQAEAFDRMTDAVYALNETWEFTFLNDRAESLLQRDTDELLGEVIWNKFPEATETEIYDHYHEAFTTQEPVTFETVYDPLETEFEIRVFPSESGLTVYFRDVTEEKRIEADLARTIDELRQLYAVTSDSEMGFETKQNQLLGLGTEYLDLPHGFVTRITETTQTIVAAHGSHELLQPGESCPLEQSYCRKTIATNEGFLAVQNARDDGWEHDPAYETFELGTYIGARLVVNDELYGTLCFAASEARDSEFTESKRAVVEVMARWLAYELEQQEHRNRLEEQNERLERFAGLVSHDLRNPLNVASGRLTLAQEECDSEHLGDIEQAHKRMQTLIEDILLLARNSEQIGDRTEIDLASIVDTCWQNVPTEDAQLVMETSATIRADESRLAQVFENFIRNAIEHGNDDVTVRIGDLEDGFCIEDDGPGMPPEIQEQIFEAGYSTTREGTGFGLAIIRQIVEAHGWEIRVTNGCEGGARFEITGVEFISEALA